MPTNASRLNISIPDIHAQIELASYYLSSWGFREAQRICASYRLVRIYYKSLSQFVWFLTTVSNCGSVCCLWVIAISTNFTYFPSDSNRMRYFFPA